MTWVRMVRSVWLGDTRLEEGTIHDLEDAAARLFVREQAAVPSEAPLLHRDPVVEHRDPLPAKGRRR